MEPMYLRLAYQILSTRSVTAQRLLKLAEELSKAQKARLDKKFKKQWGKYQKEHPATEKNESEYVKGLWDQYDRATERNEKEEAGNADDSAEKEKETETEDNLEEIDREEIEDLEDSDIDPDIDSESLSEALSEILGKDGDEKKKDIGERLESAAEKLTDIVDLDAYVLGLPGKAKQLATHLRKKQKDNEDEAQKVFDKVPDITYDQYVKETMKAGDGHIQRSKWDEMARKLSKESESDKAERQAELKKRDAEREKEEAEAEKEKAEKEKAEKEKAEKEKAEKEKTDSEKEKAEKEKTGSEKEEAEKAKRKQKYKAPDKAETIPKGEPKWDGTED